MTISKIPLCEILETAPEIRVVYIATHAKRSVDMTEMQKTLR